MVLHRDRIRPIARCLAPPELEDGNPHRSEVAVYSCRRRENLGSFALNKTPTIESEGIVGDTPAALPQAAKGSEP